jgi:hypothetical protein
MTWPISMRRSGCLPTPSINGALYGQPRLFQEGRDRRYLPAPSRDRGRDDHTGTSRAGDDRASWMRRTRRSETRLSSRLSKPCVMRPDVNWFAWSRSAKGCATGWPATPSRYASLPVAGPRPADRSGERIKDQPISQHAVAFPAVVLEPGGMSGIGVEIFAAHRVMLAADHAA